MQIFFDHETQATMLPIYVALAAVFVTMLTEWLHGRRIKKISHLAFGPGGAPRLWVMIAPLIRIAAITGAAWGLATLSQLSPKTHHQEGIADEDYQHLVLVLDVSPSMHLDDAGQNMSQTRRERVMDVLESFFGRFATRSHLLSVVAVYTDAKTLLVDSKDIEVVRYLLEEIPLHHAFHKGKTDLFAGLATAAELAKDWKKDSTIVMLLTDGDSVPPKGMPKLPSSVRNVVVVGVGDHSTGKYIDEHQSRQDISTLRQLAKRLGGVYHNGNQKHLTSTTISSLIQTTADDKKREWTLREWAIFATFVGSAAIALLPMALCHFGTKFSGGTRRRIVDGANGEEERFP